MTNAVTEILASAEGLSQQERAELAYQLVCSLEPETEQGVAEAWDVELSRRAAEIRSGQAVGTPADEVFAELRRKHQ